MGKKKSISDRLDENMEKLEALDKWYEDEREKLISNWEKLMKQLETENQSGRRTG